MGTTSYRQSRLSQRSSFHRQSNAARLRALRGGHARSGWPSFSRYRYPRLRAARYARVVRPGAWAVVPVARSHLIRRVNRRVVVREDRPEPEASSPEMTPVEVVSLEVTVLHRSTAVPTLETVTTNALCLAGRADRQHHRQYGERHKCDSFLHVAASLLFPLCGMATASGRFTLQQSVTR